MINQEVINYWHLIIFFIPLGVVGIWRWSVWLIRKIIAFFYQTPKGKFQSTLSIVTPVYNEDPEMFLLALESWKLNEPDEIIAVIDHANADLIELFKNFAKGFTGAKLIVTPKPGKRPALADGVKAARSEIIALVDSDTVWSMNIKNKLTGPFADPKVGGLVARQDVLEANTLARKMFKIHLDIRYLLEFPFLATVSDALLCLSGRTAVYRRTAIIDEVDKMVNETFWGHPMISGDDKSLTHLIQANGWKTRFLRDVRVYTPGTEKIADYMKQQLRWTRNGLRTDFKALTSRWLWRDHKILALHMLDKFIAPITLLLGPAFFAVSLYFGYWQVAAIIFGWWMVSRVIKIYPHLKERPSDIILLPVYVFMSFVMALVKIFALFTINRQGWITRWDDARLKKVSILRQAPAYLALCAVMVGYVFVVAQYREKTIGSNVAEKEMKSTVSFISQEPKSVSVIELAQKKEIILNNKKNGASGVYSIKPGDTLFILQRKFNLRSILPITFENNVPIGNINSIAVDKKIIIPVSELQNPLNADALLQSKLGQPEPLVFYDNASNTVFVKEGGSVVTLKKIRQALGLNKRPLEEIKPGEWILRANLYIGKNVTLVLDKREVTYLKLKSDASGFVWIRSQSGDMLISNTKITSWDETKDAPDLEYKDGRSYIVAKSSGRMDVINSEIGYLGYVGLPRRGGPFGGSYGLSWKITSGRFKNELLTGSVINSSIHNNYFGVYTFGATGVVIKNNQSFDNVQYGIDPHDDSNNFLVSDNRVFNNGNHGIIFSKRCFNNEISNNISYDNRLHGIMLDRGSNFNVVTGNTVYGETDGIALYASNDNIISQNNIHDNKQGIRLNRESSLNYIEQNQIFSNGTGSHIYDGSNANYLIENNIYGNTLGLSLQNVSGNVLYDNIKAGMNKKDGYIVANTNANEIK